MIIGRQNQLTIEQQVLTIHLHGTFIGTLDMPDELIHMCYWQGYFAEICCRQERHEWIPYAVNYHPSSPEYLRLLSCNFSPDHLSELTQVLEMEEQNSH